MPALALARAPPARALRLSAKRQAHTPLRTAAAALAAVAAVCCATSRGALVVAAASESPLPPPSWDGTAIVIVDHGSRRSESNAQLDEFVAMYKNLTGRAVVLPAHMEIATPTIADAVASAVSLGAKRVVIAPYFLSDGRHMSVDIPALAAEAAKANATALPGGVVVARALGGDEALVRLMDARVADALGG